MKRLSMIMMCLLAMMLASLSAKAQEITITLFPGWNWISYPKAELQDVNTALGDFVPMNGDILQSQFGSSTYVNGYWRGGVTHFMPGWGYMYYSNRTEIVSFVFGEPAPQLIVTTAEPTDITAVSAVSGGSLSSTDGSYIVVLEKGICWATHPNPTAMNDFHTENGGGINSFTAEMTDLVSNTIYYVRAFAVTSNGTFYGEEVSFTTDHSVPTGAVNGLFTINSSGDQIYFSKGNLQYIASTSTWCFATNQWDYVGGGNTNISENYAGPIDLFGWGTGDNPTSFGGSDTFSDWGVNPISNGGNTANQWRTLTNDEWNYLLFDRTTLSGMRFIEARVNGVHGVIILPDNWDCTVNWNPIDAETWNNIFEPNGAVFLPSAGRLFYNSYYNNYYLDNEGRFGFYLSATPTWCIYFWDDNENHIYFGLIGGQNSSVRLVHDVE